MSALGLVGSIPHMSKVRQRFLEALRLVTLAELERGTPRSRSAWEKYQVGERRVTEAAARELVQYLRGHAERLQQAADKLETALEKVGTNG